MAEAGNSSFNDRVDEEEVKMVEGEKQSHQSLTINKAQTERGRASKMYGFMEFPEVKMYNQDQRYSMAESTVSH